MGQRQGRGRTRRSDELRKGTREHQSGGSIMVKLELSGKTKPRKEPRFDWQEDDSGKRQRLTRAERSEGGGTGGDRGGRSESRAEKRLERAQDETRGNGSCVEEEGAGGREEGRAEVVTL